MDEGKARDILGVRADASEEEIKQAYRELVREEHPDISDHSNATERFKRIKEARELLTQEKTSRSTTSSTTRDSTRSTSARSSTSSGDSDTTENSSRSNSSRTSGGSPRNRTEQSTRSRQSSGSRSETTSANSKHVSGEAKATDSGRQRNRYRENWTRKNRYQEDQTRRNRYREETNEQQSNETTTPSSRGSARSGSWINRKWSRGTDLPPRQLGLQDILILALSLWIPIATALVYVQAPQEGWILTGAVLWLLPSCYLGKLLGRTRWLVNVAGIFRPLAGAIVAAVITFGVAIVLGAIMGLLDLSSTTNVIEKNITGGRIAYFYVILATQWSSLVGMRSVVSAYFASGSS